MSASDAFSAEESTTIPVIRESPLVTFHPSESGNENSDLEFESDDDREDNPRPTKKIKCTSKVWDEDDYKEITLANGTVKAECVRCGHRFLFNRYASTEYLDEHLANCFEEEVDESEEGGQSDDSHTTSMPHSESIDVLRDSEYDHVRFRKMIAHMILVDELPYELPEYVLFDVSMRCLTSNYQDISSDTTKQDCIAIYELEKEKLMVELKMVDRVSVTTDVWKSDQNISYMVIACQYVDEDGNLKKRNLSFCDVPPPHSGRVLCDVLHKCLVEWKIEKKVSSITVDNDMYNDVAVQMLRENLSYDKCLPLNGKLFHVRCYADLINLMAQDGLSAIKDVVIKVHDCVKYITDSEMRINMFTEIARQLKLNSVDLFLDCCTNWSAREHMLSSALVLKTVFSKYQERYNSFTSFPSEEEWEKVRVVCLFLEEFYEAIQLTQGMFHAELPTSSCFLRELTYLEQTLRVTNVGEDTCMKDMVTKMKAKFDKYWADSYLILSVAAVLDPRYKMKFIKEHYQDLYSSADADARANTIRETLCLLYNEYVKADKANPFQSPGRDPFEDYVKSELDEYLKEKTVVDEDTNFDVLSWWRKKSSKFRILSKMACDVLSIPMTTVSSEEAYTAGSKVVDPKHAYLGVETTQVLLCAGDWLRANFGIRSRYGEMNDVRMVHIS